MSNVVFLDDALQDENLVTLEKLTMLVVKLTQDLVYRFKSGSLTEHELGIVPERVRTGRLVEATIANLSTEVVEELDDDQIISIYVRQWDALAAYVKQYWYGCPWDLGLPRLYPGEEDVFYVRRIIAKKESDVFSCLVLESGLQIRLDTIRDLVDAYLNTAAGNVATPLYSVFSTVRG